MTDRLEGEIGAIELLSEVTAIVREEIGLNEAFAAPIAEAITRGLRRRLGGRKGYIPCPDPQSVHKSKGIMRNR